MFGPGPDEPDDPYADEYGEVEEPFPEYREPSMEELTANLPDESEVDGELFRAFWGLVATINLGLFALALGLMLIGFRGQLHRGGAVALLGAVTLGYAGYKYRRVRSRQRDDGSSNDGA